MDAYRGAEGTRPYAGAGWYYAEYRQRVSTEFMTLLAARLGWTRAERVLDLGAGPGQLALLAAPLLADVVAIEPEPDMLAEAQRRARALGANNVTFIAANSDDLGTLHASLGRFRTALMGQSFHWMLEKDRVLRDLSAMIDEQGGSVAFVSPRRVSAPASLEAAEHTVHAILERYLADVPPGPHPNARHDPFEAILERSAFARVERIERVYLAPLRPTLEALVGSEYTISHVLTRLGGRREAFEREVLAALGGLDAIGEIWLTLRDEALIGLR
ncbi:MAG TPA: class I SAM-dependent methyltransferase [Roseiflexaceae bacterium]|nr:class I SAM-dependent methyltransferase [Roseiflexaceae bacterium]